MIATSLDGFIADQDGGVSFLDPYQAAGDAIFGAFIPQIGLIVMGRATYDVVRAQGAWPYECPSLVMTARPLEDPPHNVVRAGLGLPALGQVLRQPGEGDVWVMGGGRTIRAFLEADLIDRMEIYLVPQILGRGVRLFPDGAALPPMRCEAAAPVEGGLVRMVYGRAAV